MDLIKLVEKKLPSDMKSVLVALSGGPDSMALIDILCKISKKSMNFKVHAAHLNHKLRDEADVEMLGIKKYCEKHNIELFTHEVNIKKLSLARKKGIEEAGRFARYDFFNKCAKEKNIDYIALGHHQNDQAETVLLNEYRGTGLTGIAGMREVNGIYIRPLLEVSKKQIMSYLHENNIEYFWDASNESDEYFRNMIRAQLNAIEDKKPGTIANIARLSKLARDDDDFINAIAKKKYSELLHGDKLYISELINLEDSVKSRIIRFWISDYIGLNDIEEVHIDAINNLLMLRSGSRISLPKNFEVEKVYDWLIIRNSNNIFINNKSTNSDWRADFMFGEINSPSGKITIKNIENGQNIMNNWPDIAIVSASVLDMNAELRYRREGDRIQPFGSAGTKKLKDFWIDKKVYRKNRNLPLLCADSQVLWIPGHAISEKLRVNSEDKFVVYLRLII